MSGQSTKQRRSTLFGARDQDTDEPREIVDFKMVTFSLGGKDYGIDIMKVKEIARFERFTYVPNTQPFVTGVYNLRGDIISVIDMRAMFNLPVATREEGSAHDGLILRLDTGLIGVIVDGIDRVVGIASESIQPPHPIFADVNLKYISGVVEHDRRLYIILDVERILGGSEQDPSLQTRPLPPRPETPSPEPELGETPGRPASGQPAADSAQAAEMLAPTLAALRGFRTTDLNRRWVGSRVREWVSSHGGELAITTPEEVDEFLAPFASPYTGRFWGDDYLRSLQSLLPEEAAGNVNVWNPGCGEGYEAYSAACAVRAAYPGSRIKVWASDNDLLNVSTAPNLTFDRSALPPFYEPYVTEGSRGLSFSPEVKQSVLFEFSDVRHQNAVPQCDLIVIRDLLSRLDREDQERVAQTIRDKATPSTVIICGTHEDLATLDGFVDVSIDPVRAFRIG